MRSKIVLLFMLTACTTGVSQAKKKGADKTIQQLKADISYLASDELEGRRTGTEGEKKAVAYIEERYKALKITPYKGSYQHPFKFIYGKQPTAGTYIKLFNKQINTPEDGFAMPFSGTKKAMSDVLPEITEQGNIWLMPLFSEKAQAEDAHFDAEKVMYEGAQEAKRGGATGIIFYDNIGAKYDVVYDAHSEREQLSIPVAYITYAGWLKYMKNIDPVYQKSGVPVEMNISIEKKERIGTNVAAYIDNKAPYTVVLGAHLDHLGYGEDGNSLFANAKKQHQIHHGADDNASGTAALMEVAKKVKAHKLKHFNYLFVHFSGEELGLYGSKSFVKEEGIDSAHTAYMINMDMVGRLNDSTHALNIGGVGTSPAWGQVPEMAGDDFKLVLDSSGVGPSDHTSFYHAGIPVLFLFTGTHSDYHKPSDMPNLINYAGEEQVIEFVDKLVVKMDKKREKPGYLVTRQPTVGKTRFKVTLGIMPDYSFHDNGVRVDGVTQGRPAAEAGILAGDIITQLGDVKILGMQSYMEALGKFSPGDKTNIKWLRAGKEMVQNIELKK